MCFGTLNSFDYYEELVWMCQNNCAASFWLHILHKGHNEIVYLDVGESQRATVVSLAVVASLESPAAFV